MSVMNLAVLGVPSSIGARHAGSEKAPAALRRAGLLEKLRSAGHDVADREDQELVVFRPDVDPARAKQQNLPAVAKTARGVAARVEAALREGRRPLVLGGDCTIALGSVAGLSRFHPDPGLVYLDRDAELNTPQTTRSGILDGMVIAHLLGRGAPELSRLSGQSPMLRPGRLALLGVGRLDPQEIPIFEALPALRMRSDDLVRLGSAAAAKETLQRLGGSGAFFVHLDVDVLDGEAIPAVDLPAAGGLALSEAAAFLSILSGDPGFAGLEVTNYNPDRDASGVAARKLVDLLAAGFAPPA
jgi:arginase